MMWRESDAEESLNEDYYLYCPRIRTGLMRRARGRERLGMVENDPQVAGAAREGELAIAELE